MKKRDLLVKILAGLLVAGMLIGLLPMFASADEVNPADDSGTVTTPGGDLHLNKSAVLQPDGTWTITLDAYATGTVKTEVRTQVIPTDIILVLDQSGSMTDSGYYINIGSGTYSAVTAQNLPTNEQMVKGSYCLWDANDQKYYPITTTRNIVSENIYWVYSQAYKNNKAGNIVCLESEDDGVVATAWSYNKVGGTFDTGFGYLISDYVGAETNESDANVNAPEIEIENPENETPEQPSIEDEIREKVEALVARLFKSVRDWFHA